MIEGLNFDIKDTELAEILQERIDQCSKKCSLYSQQADKQEELTKELGSEDTDLPKHSSDQSSNLREKSREYLQKQKEYSFLKDHLIKGEIYRLDRDALYFLGILKRRY